MGLYFFGFFLTFNWPLVLSLNPDLYGLCLILYTNPKTWLIIILSLLIPLLLEIVVVTFDATYNVSYTQILTEQAYLESAKKNPTKLQSLFSACSKKKDSGT